MLVGFAINRTIRRIVDESIAVMMKNELWCLIVMQLRFVAEVVGVDRIYGKHCPCVNPG